MGVRTLPEQARPATPFLPAVSALPPRGFLGAGTLPRPRGPQRTSLFPVRTGTGPQGVNAKVTCGFLCGPVHMASLTSLLTTLRCSGPIGPLAVLEHSKIVFTSEPLRFLPRLLESGRSCPWFYSASPAAPVYTPTSSSSLLPGSARFVCFPVALLTSGLWYAGADTWETEAFMAGLFFFSAQT